MISRQDGGSKEDQKEKEAGKEKNMTLYDIDAAILEAVDAISEIFDEETGEVTDVDAFEVLKGKFDALQMERKQKISNIACLYKQTLAEAEAIKAEKMKLGKRQQIAENRAEQIKMYLEYALGGEKFEDARCKISYRKSEGIHFAENFSFDNLPGKYIKCTIDAKKTEIKAALKAGEEIPGVSLVTKQNIQIK